ncbi:hypothetical protein HDV05_003812 [Chytridiales sp. JEL 0842]|nr:hypothetical protein HDV05_003812 [Chytridiales sp. JEL 0842]
MPEYMRSDFKPKGLQRAAAGDNSSTAVSKPLEELTKSKSEVPETASSTSSSKNTAVQGSFGTEEQERAPTDSGYVADDVKLDTQLSTSEEIKDLDSSQVAFLAPAAEPSSPPRVPSLRNSPIIMSTDEDSYEPRDIDSILNISSNLPADLKPTTDSKVDSLTAVILEPCFKVFVWLVVSLKPHIPASVVELAHTKIMGLSTLFMAFALLSCPIWIPILLLTWPLILAMWALVIREGALGKTALDSFVRDIKQLWDSQWAIAESG